MRLIAIGLSALAAGLGCLSAGQAALLNDFANSYALYQQCITDGADFDLSGRVEGGDFLSWQRGMGLTYQIDNSKGDADRNGLVNPTDYRVWNSQFGDAANISSSLCFKLYFDPVGIVAGSVTAYVDVPDPGGVPRLSADAGVVGMNGAYLASVQNANLSFQPGRQRLEAKVSFQALTPANPPEGRVTIFGMEAHDMLPSLGLDGVQVGFDFQPGDFITIFDTNSGFTTLDHTQLQDVPLALAKPLLSQNDSILAIDASPLASRSMYPVGMEPERAFDNSLSSRYANAGERNSGIIVADAASGSTVVRSMRLSTSAGNPDADPVSYELYGTNDTVLSQDNSNGMGGEVWDLIASGSTGLPLTRLADGQMIEFSNLTAYHSYRIVFPELRNFRAASSMQIGEVRLFATPEGSGPNILSATDNVLAIHLPTSEAESPIGEGSDALLDASSGTRYRNLGKENAGFIVTPTAGATRVTAFEITTSFGDVGRDPASWVLYGTNDPITSGDFSQGTDENWAMIDSGALNLPDGRQRVALPVEVENSTFYTSYRMIFPTLKNASGPGVDAMEISDIQFFGFTNAPAQPVPEPTGVALICLAAAGIVGRAWLTRAGSGRRSQNCRGAGYGRRRPL